MNHPQYPTEVMRTKIVDADKIEGDLRFDGLVKFTRDCIITGSLEARCVSASGNIGVAKSYVVYQNDFIGGYQEVGWYQGVGGSQSVGGSQ